MLDLFSSFSTLNCVYLMMLLAGIIWTTIVLIGGAVASVDIPNIDIDVPSDIDISSVDFSVDHDISYDHGTVGVSALSPMTIASFVTSFGGLGLIATQLLAIRDTLSLVFAAVGATLISAGMFFFYSQVLVAGQGSSAVQLGGIKGKQAEIIIPVPKNGLGQVAFVTQGTRTTWSARSADGEPIPRGTIVTIQAVTGNTLIVSQQ
jgi:membrane protein implicated in regulation of membrane protease activity